MINPRSDRGIAQRVLLAIAVVLSWLPARNSEGSPSKGPAVTSTAAAPESKVFADVRQLVKGLEYSDQDPATVAEAQTAIAQDIAYFAFFTTHARSHELPKGNYVFPMFEASPQALEAARLLTRLFLGTPD